MPKAFDADNPPFNRLDADEVARLKAALDIGYFRPGETIVEMGKPADALHVVIKGAVEELDGADVEAVLGPKETFDSQAVVHGAAGRRFVAVEETLCYLIPKGLTLELIRENPAFAAFFYSDISRKLDEMARAEDTQGVDSVMRSRIRESNFRPAYFVGSDATIADAGRVMGESGANAIFVRGADGRAGIVTGTDLWRSTILRRLPLDTPVHQLARFDVIASDEEEFVFEALIHMTKHNIRRVAVSRAGELVGVMEDVDLLGLFAGNSQLIPGRIDRAKDVSDLVAPARDIQAQVERLNRQGVKVEVIAEITSDLNRRLVGRVFDLVAPPQILKHGCLIVMGSEGRGEQTVRTDQDNGLILAEPVDKDLLDRFRADFQAALESFGFPPCPGNVMVSNPIWSQPIEQFEQQLKRWVMMPEPESPMFLGIFVDAIPVAGKAELCERAKLTLFDMMKGEAAYLSQFARAIDNFPGPGGMLTTVMAAVGREEVIDIKKSGVFPIVHGMRCLAVEHGLREASTIDRIAAAARIGIFGDEFREELSKTFLYFLALRLKSQLQAAKRGTVEGESLVRPSELTTLDRDLLRDGLRVVKRFREVIRNHFKLGMF